MPRALLCLLLLLPTTAQANHLKEGILSVNKALGRVRGAGDDCKAKALAKLKDSRDALNMARGKASVETFTKARRGVEDALDQSGSACTAEATQAMQAALDTLQAGLDSLTEAAATPSPAEKKLKEKRACWNYVNDWGKSDPGCHATLNGNYAIGKTKFSGVLAKLRRAGDRFGKTAVVEEELGYAKKMHLTCMQLSTIAGELLHDNDRLELVKTAAERIVDPRNSHVAIRPIRDARVRKEAQRVIAEAAN